MLADLYKKMEPKPYKQDLDALRRDLGISVEDGRAASDDGATLAPIRRAITALPPG